MIEAKVIADSWFMDIRLTSFELTYPRFIHAEVMTYCTFARNSASSRAIPIKKMIEAVRTQTAMPVSWGKNQKGMSASEDLSPEDQVRAKAAWLRGAERAILTAEELMDIGVHKQIANRPMEPFMHMTTVLTGADIDLSNMYSQRLSPEAQPEFQALGETMLAAQNKSRPRELLGAYGYPYGPLWHLPYVGAQEEAQLGLWTAQVVSVARCARASYTNQGKVYTLKEDQERYDDLVDRHHWSPLEHVAHACQACLTGRSWWNGHDEHHGKFRRFQQLRHRYHEERVTKFARLLDPLRPPDVD